MTNIRQAAGNKRRGRNIKDGHYPGRRLTKKQQEAEDQLWLDAGFEYSWLRGAPRLTYTWQGDIPVIEITPGIANDQTGQFRDGMVARNSDAGFELCFPYGTPPVSIADQLDDQILEIMRHDAEVDDQPLVGDGDDWIYF